MAENNGAYLHLIYSYDEMKTTDAQQEYIESLERFIINCRDAANRGEELYPDSMYDAAIDILKTICPDHELLSCVWSEDSGEALDEDIDSQLMINPMLSIQTIKDLSVKEMQAFCSLMEGLCEENGEVDMHASMKLNGHGIRLVYKDGIFTKAHTRGRSSKGRDITSAISLLVPPFIEELATKGIVEIRGEIVLPLDKLEEARKYKPDIKSAFTGVSAMIRESASEAETRLLKLVTYAIYSSKLHFDTLQEAYAYLSTCGFEVPLHICGAYNGAIDFVDFAANVVRLFETKVGNYPYFTDGVVLSVNNLQLLHDLGVEGTTRNGNVALKVGFWKQDMYSATIEEIIWKPGRSKLTPVARIEPTLTANGASVTNVPLYAPIHIINLAAYPGNTIYFHFGGEAGVVPCYPNGELITAK